MLTLARVAFTLHQWLVIKPLLRKRNVAQRCKPYGMKARRVHLALMVGVGFLQIFFYLLESNFYFAAAASFLLLFWFWVIVTE